VNSYASVGSFTTSSIVPGLPLTGILQYMRPLNTPEEVAQTYYGVNVDQHFFETYKIGFLAGSNFSENAPEQSSIILSEKAAALLGFNSPEEAVHQKIIGPSNTEMEVIGVVENYHQLSPQNDYYPSYYTLMRGVSMQIFYSVKFDNAENVPAFITFLEDQWKLNFPENAFEYFFLDTFFDQQFKEDLQFRRVLSAFTLIAIIITCIGLFAMVLYQIARKTKEIGIRKVLGASVESILILFSKDFIKLIVIANILAWPIAYISLQEWLTDFAFKIDIQWGWIFIISLCTLIVISLLTVSIHILKAAMVNPVDSLRYE
jgi:putative ABC transport system permease protein